MAPGLDLEKYADIKVFHKVGGTESVERVVHDLMEDFELASVTRPVLKCRIGMTALLALGQIVVSVSENLSVCSAGDPPVGGAPGGASCPA